MLAISSPAAFLSWADSGAPFVLRRSFPNSIYLTAALDVVMASWLRKDQNLTIISMLYIVAGSVTTRRRSRGLPLQAQRRLECKLE
jgi:hypothetical protein